MILEIVITALAAGGTGAYFGYRLGQALYEAPVLDETETEAISQKATPYVPAPRARFVGTLPDPSLNGGAPLYSIVSDDGSILFSSASGAVALRAWEGLRDAPQGHQYGLTFVQRDATGAHPRGRIEARHTS